MSNSWGKSYVDKYIHKWENKNTVGYVVFIHRNDLKINERFETLEKAQAFRDEALRLCEIKRIQKLRADLQINEYPYNLIEALEFNVVDVIENFDSHFDYVCKNYLTEREYLIIINTYQMQKTFDESAKIFDISKARTQQICVKALCKLKYHHDFFLKGKYSDPYKIALQDYQDFIADTHKRWSYESAMNFINNYEKTERDYKYTELEISEFNFSVRTYNSLRRAGISTVSQLVLKNADDLYKLRNLGKKSLKEIFKVLNIHGYCIEGQEKYGVYYDKK